MLRPWNRSGKTRIPCERLASEVADVEAAIALVRSGVATTITLTSLRLLSSSLTACESGGRQGVRLEASFWRRTIWAISSSAESTAGKRGTSKQATAALVTMADPARVLFVEDDLGLAGIVVRHLRARGHDADGPFGRGALELVAQASPKRRPARHKFRAPPVGPLRGGGLRAAGSPPVYVVSATSMPPARLREFGLAGFLPKPFAVSTLIEIVERHHADTGGDGTIAPTRPPQGEIDAF